MTALSHARNDKKIEKDKKIKSLSLKRNRPKGTIANYGWLEDLDDRDHLMLHIKGVPHDH
jgi:hypothetical protein